MRLLRPPRRPDSAPAIRITIGLRNAPESWRDYLYWNVELDDELIATLTSVVKSYSHVTLTRCPSHHHLGRSAPRRRRRPRHASTAAGFPLDDAAGRHRRRAAGARRCSRRRRAHRHRRARRSRRRRDADARRRRRRRDRLRLGRCAPWATGLHQVDNPVFDRDGNLFVTYSGSRGQEAPVSIFRVTRAGTREPFVVGHRQRHVDGVRAGRAALRVEPLRRRGLSRERRRHARAGGVGPRRRVRAGVRRRRLAVRRRSVGHDLPRATDGTATPFATLPPSVAAFHLAMSPDGELFVSAPTLGVVRLRLPHRSRRRGAHAAVAARPAAGAGVLAGRRRCTSSTRWPARAALYRFADLDGDAGAGRLRAARWSASRSARAASSSWRRTTPHLIDFETSSHACDFDRSDFRAHVAAVRAQADRGPAAAGRRPHVAEARARRRRSGHAGDRRGHRRRHLLRRSARRRPARSVPTARSSATAPGPALIFSFILLGAVVRAGGALLRGAGGDDSAGRERLRVFVRDARRAGRVDHRLGSDSRVRGRQRRGRDRLGRLLHVAAAAASASTCRTG